MGSELVLLADHLYWPMRPPTIARACDTTAVSSGRRSTEGRCQVHPRYIAGPWQRIAFSWASCGPHGVLGDRHRARTLAVTEGEYRQAAGLCVLALPADSARLIAGATAQLSHAQITVFWAASPAAWPKRTSHHYAGGLGSTRATTAISASSASRTASGLTADDVMPVAPSLQPRRQWTGHDRATVG
jgi:hypothetical protein